MIVTRISKDSIDTISLPQKIKGQYSICDNAGGISTSILSIEAVNGEWLLKSGKNAQVLDTEGNACKSIPLESLRIYPIKRTDDEMTSVFTEPITDDRQTFTKYLVRDDVDLIIGRAENCDIYYSNRFVSSTHAVLSFKSGCWSIKDLNSTNGTFVNEKRITETQLDIGDSIFIMGLRIIIGKSFAAFNNPDGMVSVCSKLIKFVSQTIEPANDEEDYELPEKDYFYTSPRFKRDIEVAHFKIDSPPQSPLGEEMPLILLIGSSIAMGMMSVVTLVSAVISKNITSALMGGTMMIGTLLLPTITKKYEKKLKNKKEALRQRKYREYLQSIEVSINEACQLQEEIHKENDITVSECESRIIGVKPELWNRNNTQNDFLRLRVGTGEGKLQAEFSYSEKRFTLNDDNLEEELCNLCERPKILHNLPITISLLENFISGVIGDDERIRGFAQGIMIQLASFYSYEDVKFVFIYDAEDEDTFGFVKWFPHVWDNDNKFRYIATNMNELKELNAALEGIVSSRIEMNKEDLEDEMPYYIIFSMSRRLFARSETIKRILNHKENIRFSIITFNHELRELPKECSMVVEIDGMRGKMYNKDDISGKSIDFTPDIYPEHDPAELAVKLANVSLDTVEGNFKLPSMITFLEMFGVGKVEHLNALARWKENDPTKSLESAVGVDVFGDTFKLDLHEKFHGPHGLVAGMTGSGKSEFIITYILSLAVNYHPYEVAFILIDYKGGGMAKSFENLPHTAGIITNLDGSAIKRSLISIESELKRRQAIFAEASKKVGVSNIDIYKYQKLYREGTVSEPLQHLFIISDEFAELKTQQPDFMTQLVSAARIGRSLGVHLILATQKPSGVVDDQIWSNSKFRVCLKVQERADSMDMLKRPDAAELSDTGRFYLQVGYNELFELGQSAWAGAPYIPSDKPVVDKDNSVVVIDKNGHTVKKVKIDKNQMLYSSAKKQLDAITAYLQNIAEEEKIKIKPLWLDPIPAIIMLEDLKNKYSAQTKPFFMEPIIGEYDDPANQRQCLLRLPLSAEGNTIVYGSAGSGKTSFINAVIYSLVTDHSPEEVNIYILDFASETLRAFSKAPHVGDVLLSYESEKIGNLFKLINGELQRRKKLFTDYGGDYASYAASGAEPVPSIVIFINSFAAFAETYEDKTEIVSFLSREGVKYGIYFIITAVGAMGVSFRMVQNFKQIITLQLNDESDYATVVGKTDGLYPSKFKGRGLIKLDGLYEFQVASITKDSNPFGYIRGLCEELEKKYPGQKARKVPVLPDRVDIEFLSELVDRSKPLNLPVGVEKNSLNTAYYPLGRSYISFILSSGDESRQLTADLCLLIGSCTDIKGVILDIPRTVKQEKGNLKLMNTTKDCEAGVAELFDTVLYRNNSYKEALEQGKSPEKYEQLLIVVNSAAELFASLSDVGREKLGLILERGRSEYGLCVLLSDSMKGVGTYSYEKWYKAQFSPSDGIWVGAGIADQYQLRANKTTSEMHEDIGPEYGFVLQKGKAVKTKLLRTVTEEDSDE